MNFLRTLVLSIMLAVSFSSIAAAGQQAVSNPGLIAYTQSGSTTLDLSLGKEVGI